jgi:hypothetical protein
MYAVEYIHSGVLEALATIDLIREARVVTRIVRWGQLVQSQVLATQRQREINQAYVRHPAFV